jgi:hypothetical protein
MIFGQRKINGITVTVADDEKTSLLTFVSCMALTKFIEPTTLFP